jgi:probable HAF family extracellular repeat protein
VKVSLKRALVSGTAALSLLAATGAQAVIYRITDIHGLFTGAGTSQALDVNNLGQVVGFSNGASGDRAFVWDSATGTMVSNLTSSVGRAHAINEAGQIAGEYAALGGTQAFRWSNGTLYNLSGSTGNSAGYAINESGYVAGTSNSVSRIWEYGTTSRPIPSLSNKFKSPIQAAWDINDSGTVVGASGNHGYSYSGGGIALDLGILPTSGGDSAIANAVNNDGWIVGQSIEFGVGWRSGFIYRNNQMTSLGDLPGDAHQSSALDINNGGKVVGFGTVAKDTKAAFIWDAGNPEAKMIDLNTLIDPSDPLADAFHLREAHAISDSGYIVGFGTYGTGKSEALHAFLLTPTVVAAIPEPHQYAMMVAGLGIVGWMARRRRAAGPSGVPAI